ncbi:hypothetical protein TrLO_g2230 [Triparma laevis f. longispina]|uniref:Uncharacterized protein n=1 Tax=Triparma laevis f. longispina TaxID=1714387 RepID=A0A9W7CG53_9STRA|nr:hypothetical protein TrLO_g2230 [Triparma laevis f. longispina]
MRKKNDDSKSTTTSSDIAEGSIHVPTSLSPHLPSDVYSVIVPFVNDISAFETASLISKAFRKYTLDHLRSNPNILASHVFNFRGKTVLDYADSDWEEKEKELNRYRFGSLDVEGFSGSMAQTEALVQSEDSDQSEDGEVASPPTYRLYTPNFEHGSYGDASFRLHDLKSDHYIAGGRGFKRHIHPEGIRCFSSARYYTAKLPKYFKWGGATTFEFYLKPTKKLTAKTELFSYTSNDQTHMDTIKLYKRVIWSTQKTDNLSLNQYQQPNLLRCGEIDPSSRDYIHLVLSVSGEKGEGKATKKVYLNGEFVGRKRATAPEDFERNRQGLGFGFDGIICFMRMWRREIQEDEAINLFVVVERERKEKESQEKDE